MPLAVDNLTSESNAEAIRTAVSESIAQCIREGKSQKECAGMAFSIARDKTGKSLGGPQ